MALSSFRPLILSSSVALANTLLSRPLSEQFVFDCQRKVDTLPLRLSSYVSIDLHNYLTYRILYFLIFTLLCLISSGSSISLSFLLSLYLIVFIYVPICLFIYLFIHLANIAYLIVSISFFYLPIYFLGTCLPIYLSIYVPKVGLSYGTHLSHLSTYYPPVYLSIYPPIYLSIYLPIFLSTYSFFVMSSTYQSGSLYTYLLSEAYPSIHVFSYLATHLSTYFLSMYPLCVPCLKRQQGATFVPILRHNMNAPMD